MTLPYERRWAITNARDFLLRLTDSKATPRVPRSVRQEASYRLKNFPTEPDMIDVVAAFGPLEDRQQCSCLFTSAGKQTHECMFHAEQRAALGGEPLRDSV